MTDTEVIDELCALLCLLPGVSVAWKQTPPKFYRIGLRVGDYKSLALLAHWQCNFVIAVETDWNCSASHDDAECLRYDLRIPDRSSGIESYVFGQYLLGYLESQGLLTREAAERKRPAWSIPD